MPLPAAIWGVFILGSRLAASPAGRSAIRYVVRQLTKKTARNAISTHASKADAAKRAAMLAKNNVKVVRKSAGRASPEVKRAQADAKIANAAFKTAKKGAKLEEKLTPVGRAKAITTATVTAPEVYEAGKLGLEAAKALGLYHKGGTKTKPPSKGKSKGKPKGKSKGKPKGKPKGKLKRK